MKDILNGYRKGRWIHMVVNGEIKPEFLSSLLVWWRPLRCAPGTRSKVKWTKVSLRPFQCGWDGAKVACMPSVESLACNFSWNYFIYLDLEVTWTFQNSLECVRIVQLLFLSSFLFQFLYKGRTDWPNPLYIIYFVKYVTVGKFLCNLIKFYFILLKLSSQNWCCIFHKR